MQKTSQQTTKQTLHFNGKLRSAKETAEEWNVSLDTVLRLCRERELSHVKIRGRVMIPTDAADAYLRQQTVVAQ